MEDAIFAELESKGLSDTELTIELMVLSKEYEELSRRLKEKAHEIGLDAITEPIRLSDGRKLSKKKRNTPEINQEMVRTMYHDEYIRLAENHELDLKIDQVRKLIPEEEIRDYVEFKEKEYLELSTR